VLHRYAERRSVLAEGTPRARTVEQGTTVVVWPSLAAFDERVFPSPFTFMRGRPQTHYMGFGHGLHRCLGEHVGQALIEQMARALFALEGLSRARGRAGTVQNGPLSKARFPISFRVRFDPS
jgi:cytochrome P450